MRIYIPRILNIKIKGFPLKETKVTKHNYHTIISFVSGSLLIVSESLPFFDNTSNGIIHCLSEIQKEYKTDFK